MLGWRTLRGNSVKARFGASISLILIGFTGTVGIIEYIDTLPVAFAVAGGDQDVTKQTAEQEQSSVNKNADSENKPASPPSPSQPSLPQKAAHQVAAARTSQATMQQTTVQLFDQFSGTALDTSQWEAMSLPKAYRNNEEQLYSPNNAAVSGGMLRITGSRGHDGQWRSAEVHSKWRYKYGDFEVRLALDKVGQGVWPAAWLLGDGAGWPDAGEIDIFENVNTDPMAIATIHGGGANGHWMSQKSLWGYKTTDFHTYKISKSPGVISWWVDGVKMKEWTKSNTLSAGQVWPFEDYTNMGILNLALGGNWPGPTNSSTPETITMMVDYFKISNAS